MMSFTPIDIILADDHEIFRDGFAGMLKRTPQIRLAGEASDGAELIRLTRQLKPDIIVTDIKMPEMDGIEATRRLKKEFPGVRVIALSMYDEDDLIMDMLDAGAKGYLLKNAHKSEIIAAFKSVYNDGTYYCKNTSRKLSRMIAQSDFYASNHPARMELSERELDVIRLICEQKSNKEIAGILTLSKRTVEGYREKILEKTGAKNSAGLVIYALKNKIWFY